MPPSPTDPAPVTTPINLRRRIYEMLLSESERGFELPTQDDVRRLFGGLSDDVDLHLSQLAREGLLILDKDGEHGISLVPTYARLPEIGLLGKVARQFSERGGCLPRASIGLDLRGVGVPVPPGVQAVQVLDDRMIDADIQFGDIALIVNSVPIESGSIVAVEEGSVVVLRRYIVVSGIPHFLAENPDDPRLSPAWDLDVQGVLWGLIRVEECRAAFLSTHRSKPTTGTLVKKHEHPRRTAVQSPASTPRPLKRKIKPRDHWTTPPPVIGLNEPGGSYQTIQEEAECSRNNRCLGTGQSEKSNAEGEDHAS